MFRLVPVLLLASACTTSGLEGRGVAAPDRVEARSCLTGRLPTRASGDFDHWSNELTALQYARHVAEDVLATGADWIPLHAKFAYGPLNDDLEDEVVEVWVDRCGQTPEFLGTVRTDDKGWISASLHPDAIDAYGEFTLFYRVAGDGTIATSTLRRYPVGTRLQVFDIDGTLTSSDMELFRDLFSELGTGSYVPEARVDALETVWARADQGYEVLYLTGRPYWLDGITREWLDTLGFPPGSLHLARTNGEVVPTESGVGDYKAAYLDSLLAAGFEVDFAYGNATTDIYGYRMAGIPPETTLIMGTHGGEDGTLAGGEGYTAHLARIASEPAVQQPFSW
ncbi:MAG: hypothetical protein H6737_22725 [Alphaproteobacteria bacterium]|nr:hypothetical protein [Alphaproteobacteria bacterium]